MAVASQKMTLYWTMVLMMVEWMWFYCGSIHARMKNNERNFVWLEPDINTNKLSNQNTYFSLRNQVFGSNARRLDGCSHKRRPSQPNSPGSSDNGQSQAKGDSKTSKSIGRHVSQDFRPSLITVFGCTLRRAHGELFMMYKCMVVVCWSCNNVVLHRGLKQKGGVAHGTLQSGLRAVAINFTFQSPHVCISNKGGLDRRSPTRNQPQTDRPRISNFFW